MNKHIFAAIGLITIVGLLGVTTTFHFASAAVELGCTQNPHDADAPTANPHDGTETGNPHDSAHHHHVGPEGPDSCPGAQ